jgi:hypothetical protein
MVHDLECFRSFKFLPSYLQLKFVNSYFSDNFQQDKYEHEYEHEHT